jgi:hypothetical protein
MDIKKLIGKKHFEELISISKTAVYLFLSASITIGIDFLSNFSLGEKNILIFISVNILLTFFRKIQKLYFSKEIEGSGK